MKYKLNDVFVAGGMPTITYIKRSEKNLESQLQQSIGSCKLITITGSTKCGKTVLVNQIFPRKNNLWIDGGSISKEEDFWELLVEQLNLYNEEGVSNEKSIEIEASSSGETGLTIPLITKLKLFLGIKVNKGNTKTINMSRSLSPKIKVLSSLRKLRKALVIDDFHYIPRELQGYLIRVLKPYIFDGFSIILIAIPHRRYDAVKVEKEMNARIDNITIPPWEIDELAQIGKEGFPKLNISISTTLIQSLAEESFRSPHLMQEFCRKLSLENNVINTVADVVKIEKIDNCLFKNVASDTGKLVFDKLAKGPRQRTDRLLRTLVDGSQVDIYKVILYSLAKISPGLDTIEYDTIRTAVKSMLKDNIPQKNEITRILDKMNEIALSDESSVPVLDWEKEEQKLHITDPFFAFYLKWGFDEEWRKVFR